MLELKGYVETPTSLVDLMVDKLFKYRSPSSHSIVLVPGCGKGAFIEGIIRWCYRHNSPVPRVVGIEVDPDRALKAKEKFEDYKNISIKNEDFLRIPDLHVDHSKYDFIIGNPPYVPINQLSKDEKKRYRGLFQSAQGRFDLYLLFFERALQCLAASGRLVFVTPEKFMYIQSAEPLRKLLAHKLIEEIHLLNDDVFGELVTYPAVTTIVNQSSLTMFRLISQSGQVINARLSSDGSSWLPYDNLTTFQNEYTLLDICERISCGVATGADSVFVKKNTDLTAALRSFAYPTISGRELVLTDWKIKTKHSMIIPYDPDGKLMDFNILSALMPYLLKPDIRKKLDQRTCVAHKRWYAFHENPPLQQILKPKILCKDITKQPFFWVDKEGTIVPRHSVYYIVPIDPDRVEEIAEYLNSYEVKSWLQQRCQHAANSYLRLQSHVLKKLPIPRQLVEENNIPTNSKTSKLVLEQVRCPNDNAF